MRPASHRTQDCSGTCQAQRDGSARLAAPAHLEAHNDDPDHPEDVGGKQAVEHVELILHLARVDHVEQLREGG